LEEDHVKLGEKMQSAERYLEIILSDWNRSESFSDKRG